MIRLMKLCKVRIILGRGTSVKSAPFMPFDNEIDPNVNTKKTDSSSATNTVLGEGWKATNPTVPVTTKIAIEKKTMKKYLLFTRLLGEIGDE